MVPPGAVHGPAVTVGLSIAGGRSWSRVCTPANRPAGWLAWTVTLVPVMVSWYPWVPTLAGAPDSDSAMVPEELATGTGYPVEARSIPARYAPTSGTSEETLADEARVNVAPLAVALTGTGTATLGKAAVAAFASIVPAAPATPTNSVAAIRVRRILGYLVMVRNLN